MSCISLWRLKRTTPRFRKLFMTGGIMPFSCAMPGRKLSLTIHPEIRDKLRKAFQVMVVETILDNIKETYPVEMEIVDNIPLDWNKAGLGTWEEVFLSESNHA